MSTGVVLHGYWRSSCSYRVRIVLHFKGIAFDTVPVSLVKNEHLSPPFSALNPHKSVPTLLVDGLALSQSLAIV
jgi:maleylacetoacetate isomerase